MKGTFDHLVNAAFRGKADEALMSESVDALKGVSPDDAQHLDDAFGIRTVADLASNRFVRAATAILNAGAHLDHDPGPDPSWGNFFDSAPLAAYQAHPNDFRLDFGPVYYRGRLDGTARVVIVGQDPAANELVANRIFVGASGQRTQGFLRKLGITRDYIMLNTFLYPVFGQVIGHDLEDLSHDPLIMGFRNEFLNRIVDSNPVQAVIAVGSAARDALEHWPNPRNLQWQAITHPSARDNERLLANWNEGLTVLRRLTEAELSVAPDLNPYGSDWTDADYTPIPRRDLPFGTPEWHGVGSHARRAKKENGRTDHKRIIWKAP